MIFNKNTPFINTLISYLFIIYLILICLKKENITNTYILIILPIILYLLFIFMKLYM